MYFYGYFKVNYPLQYREESCSINWEILCLRLCGVFLCGMRGSSV